MGFFDIFRRPKLKPEERPSPAGKRLQPAVARWDNWRPGQILLDDFAVQRVLGEGGMGKVYLVKSQTTGMRFAVKRARGLSESERRNFLAELQTWIDLPEHPNLVPCRFFRTVGDEVLIFAEYVGGGSLKNWIDSRKLYEGGATKTLERLLDTAIQFACRGLQCVHELGLVHQDVKPANVMMDKDAHVAMHGVKARVTDCGSLTGARGCRRAVRFASRREYSCKQWGLHAGVLLAGTGSWPQARPARRCLVMGR